MSRWSRVLGWCLFVPFVLFVLIGCGGMFLVQVPLLLAFGWARFLWRVLPQVGFSGAGLAQTAAVVAVLGVGAHLFLGWLWRQMRPEATRPWPRRWTASLLALLVLLFCATMATVGIGHQVGWMARSEEKWLESTWGRSMRGALHGASVGLCTEAVDVLERDPSGASLSRELLARPGTRAAAESVHTVLVQGAGGERTLLLFPRDPRQREEEGVLRCWPGSSARERHPVGVLPRLLTGEAVAGGIEY